MPRNGTGGASLTLPPAVPGTLIIADDYNAKNADIVSMLAGSVASDGQTPMSGNLKLVAGDSMNPGLSWNAQASTGFFKPTGDAIGITVSAVEAARFTADRNLLIGSTANTGERLQITGTSKFVGKTTHVSGGVELTAGDLVIASGNISVAGTSTFTGALTGTAATFSGNVAISGTTTGVTKAMVGLGNADNTSDVDKPVSTAVQALFNQLVTARRGTYVYCAMGTVPTGALAANGQAVSRTTYAALFSLIGTTYGAGDGSTTFNVPDARGVAIRGLDGGRGLDSGRTLGSYQADLYVSHAHGVNDPSHAHGVADPGHIHSAWTDAQGNHSHGVNVGNFGAGGANNSVAYSNTNVSTFPATDVQGNHAHGVGIGASGTGIGIYASGTGVSIQASGGAETRMKNIAAVIGIWY